MHDDHAVRFDLTPPSEDQFSLLVGNLSAAERHLLLDRGEEEPFRGAILRERRRGLYTCRLCGLPVFEARFKFDSETGWPSFAAPFRDQHLRLRRDTAFALERTEATCARCGAHLGHVFADGPPPRGERYCINSGSIAFIAAGETLPDKLGRGEPEGALWAA